MLEIANEVATNIDMIYSDSYNTLDIIEWANVNESVFIEGNLDYVMEASIFSKIKEKVFKGKTITKRQVTSTPQQTPSQTVALRLYGGTMTGPVKFINGCKDPNYYVREEMIQRCSNLLFTIIGDQDAMFAAARPSVDEKCKAIGCTAEDLRVKYACVIIDEKFPIFLLYLSNTVNKKVIRFGAYIENGHKCFDVIIADKSWED